MSRIVALHRSRLLQIVEEANSLEGTARRLAQMAQEVLDRGGVLQAHGQITFITGSYARLLKDVGVVEQLQGDGVAQKGKSPL